MPYPTIALAAILSTTVALSVPANAEETMSHDGQATMGDMSPSSIAFAEANDRMHADMPVKFTGNADADFLSSMIPHHLGAVDMAKVVLEHGSDPDVKKLAEAVIAAQEAEIKWMQDWLAKNGG